jgi:hypothetical protein
MLTIRPYPALRMSRRTWRVTSNTPIRLTRRMRSHSTFIELLERLVAAKIPGIVDKNVDALRLTNDLLKGFCDLVGVRHINLQGLSTIKFDLIDVPNPDVSARSHELCRDSPPNSPSTARDDGCLQSV